MVRWALTLEYCTLGARERVAYRKHVLLVGLGRHSRHAEAHSRSSSALVIDDTGSQGAASVPEGAPAAGVKAPITLMAFPKDGPKACKSAGRTAPLLSTISSTSLSDSNLRAAVADAGLR